MRIEVGADHPVTASQLHGGEERETAWRAITSASARFTQYQQQTDRELPIVRLTERPTGGPATD